MDRPKCIKCGKPAERNGKYWRKLCRSCRGYYGRPQTRARKQGYIFGLDFTTCELCHWRGECDVHHVDRDWKNGSRDNLQVLCPNCHRNIHNPLSTAPL